MRWSSVLIVCLLPALARAGDWYQWRGPEQNGVCRETGLPDHWSPEGQNIVWVNDCGGMSSPIVMRGKVYTFTRSGEIPVGEGLSATLDPGPATQECLTCIDAASGKVLWQHGENMTMTDDPFHRMGWSNPVGDPSTGRVYALGAQCTLYCFEGDSGAVVWKRQMTEEFGMISTFGGRTPSPALDEDQLFIAGVSFGWGDHAGGQHRIFAFDKNTGQLNWSAGTGGIPVDAPYNTPVIAVVGGQRLAIFAAGDGGVHAFQARTGKKVWSFKGSKHGMNSSVVVEGDRVYASWDLDNYDSTRLGRVVCLDGAHVVNGSPREIWRVDGLEAGFPSPTIHGGTLYVATDNAQLYAIDALTGHVKYHHGFGTIGKASLVWADGKIYFPEANGRMWILRPTDTKFEVLSHVDLEQKLGREYVIFGSVAISDGRIFLNAANKMYCIGPKEPHPQSDPIPAPVAEPPIEGQATPAWVQVLPADVVLHPGQQVGFACRLFDARGRLIGPAMASWSVGQLTLPPPPPRPKELMRLNSMAAAQDIAGAAASAAPSAPAAMAVARAAAPPKHVGNLQGRVDPSGLFTAGFGSGSFQGGAVIASVGTLSGQARVRVMGGLPWSIRFADKAMGQPPLTWIGAGMKFAARVVDGRAVLVKLTDIPLYARARTYFGTPDMKDYTISADVCVRETAFNEGGTIVHKMPDVGLIDTRYVLELKGSKQTLGIHSWPAALPRNELESDLALHKTIPFAWSANTWYREKLMVRHVLDSTGPKAILSGKVWAADQPEPADWNIVLEDSVPNASGAPGLWGFSNDHEIYYDNIEVTPNPTETSSGS